MTEIGPTLDPQRKSPAGRKPKYVTELTINICVNVPRSLAATLTQLAEDSEVSRSELVTALLRRALK